MHSVLSSLLFWGIISVCQSQSTDKSLWDGEALPIISTNDKGQPICDENNLKEIFLNEKIKNTPVAILGINGAFRHGKSFLLNLILDYKRVKTFNNWSNNLPKQRFLSKKGVKSVTKGLIIWSRPLIVKQSDGKDIAVFFMDTEGLFNSDSPENEDVTLFTISAFLSSVQLYMLDSPIKSNELKNFEFFLDFTRFYAKKTSENPFQKLIFVLRDWHNSDEYPYGFEGGKQYFDDILNENRNTILGDSIQHVYPDMETILMPSPGSRIVGKEFDGKPSSIDSEFLEQVQLLVRTALDPKKLNAKKLKNGIATGTTIFNLLLDLTTDLETAEILETVSQFRNFAGVKCRTCIKKQTEYYEMEIQKMPKEYTEDQMRQTHETLKTNCINSFIKESEGFNDDILQPFIDQLKKDIEKLFEIRKTEIENEESSEKMTSLLIERLNEYNSSIIETENNLQSWILARMRLMDVLDKASLQLNSTAYQSEWISETLTYMAVLSGALSTVTLEPTTVSILKSTQMVLHWGPLVVTIIKTFGDKSTIDEVLFFLNKDSQSLATLNGNLKKLLESGDYCHKLEPYVKDGNAKELYKRIVEKGYWKLNKIGKYNDWAKNSIMFVEKYDFTEEKDFATFTERLFNVIKSATYNYAKYKGNQIGLSGEVNTCSITEDGLQLCDENGGMVGKIIMDSSLQFQKEKARMPMDMKEFKEFLVGKMNIKDDLMFLAPTFINEAVKETFKLEDVLISRLLKESKSTDDFSETERGIASYDLIKIKLKLDKELSDVKKLRSESFATM